MVQSVQHFHAKIRDKIKSKKGCLPEKHFVARNSLLTDLGEMPHFRIVYSIFIVVLLSLFVNAVAKDLIKKGKILLGFQHLPQGLTNFHMALFIWICMFISTVAVYWAFLFWATFRVKVLIDPKSRKKRLWDISWILLYILYCLNYLYFTVTAIIDNSLQLTLSIAMLLEMVRMLMKTYAFVRSNAPRTLNYKSHDDKVFCPEFSKFLYFSFAPTLVYRDSYPRTTNIRWNYVIMCVTEVAGVVLCMHFVREYIVISSFEEYDLTRITVQDVILIILQNGIPWMFFLICLVYAMLHVWQNAFAEMLRFGDRLFYKDWWNSTSYGKYYSSWNLIVHDWLYTYIYKDMYEIVLPKNKLGAKTMVFFVSACFHELIFAVAFRFLYPICFVLFFVMGLPLSFVKFKNDFFGNSLFLYTLTFGFSIVSSGMMLEYYARASCPVENITVASYFIPKTLNYNLNGENIC